MFQEIFTMFNYTFIIRAIIVGIFVSLSASLLGINLVLKRQSMIGDGLSHVAFSALAISMVLNSEPLIVSLPIVLAAAFFLQKITELTTVKGDAAIAVFSSTSLALGVIVISRHTGMNTDVCNYMFGSILAIKHTELIASVVISLFVIAVYIMFFNKFFTITFDEEFAKATGVNVSFYNTLLAFLTSIVIVLGMRLMGALLMSSLIIFPALSSMRIFKNFLAVSISSLVLSLFCFLLGIVTTYVFNLPTGASIVAINFIVLFLCSIIGRFKTGEI